MNPVISPEDALSRTESAQERIAKEKAAIVEARKVEADKGIDKVLGFINNAIRGACTNGESSVTVPMDGAYRDLHKVMVVHHLQTMGYRTRVWEANDLVKVMWGRNLDEDNGNTKEDKEDKDGKPHNSEAAPFRTRLPA